MPDISFFTAFVAAALTGILSGYGIGGGTLLILILVFFFGADQRAAQTVNLCYFIPAAGASLFFHAKEGRVDLAAFRPVMLAGIVSAGVFSLLAPYIGTDLIKRMFGVGLIYIGVREVFAKSQPRRAKSR